MKTTMKIAVIAMMGMGVGVSAQKVISLEGENDPNFVNKGGYLGLGTKNPWSPITINSVSKVNGNTGVAIAMDGTDYPEIGYRLRANGNNYYQVLYDGKNINWKHYENNRYVSKLSLSNNGYLGLNTKSPWSPITINSVSKANGNTGVAIAMDGTDYPEIGYRLKANGNNYYQVLYDGKNINWKHYENNRYVSKLSLANNGNMALKGKFESREIKVTKTPTADFVFEEDYNLPTLKSIEKHIKEKKHLPEIASAKEMEKNGVNVGDFQIQLLQKIEELTLYTIEQEKKIKKLEKQNSEIKELKALVQKLLKDKN